MQTLMGAHEDGEALFELRIDIPIPARPIRVLAEKTQPTGNKKA
jgi:hypothetical protein